MPGCWRIVALLCLLASVLASCGTGQWTMPPGAQELHVVVAGSEVRLDPAVVRAGDVYVVMDTPGSSVGFVSRKQGDVEIGPLSDADLDRLAHGDTGFTIGGFENRRSSAEGGDLMGPMGNVVQAVLVEGKYAFVVWDLEGIRPLSIAVLEVRP